MSLSPELEAFLDRMREWARDPQALIWPIQGRAIYPEDVTGKTNEQLLEFIRARCADTER